MRMLKKKFLLVLFLILTSCGYEAIHSKKNIVNYDFSISQLSFVGDRNINLKIKEKLNNYTQTKKSKVFILKVITKTERLTLAKDNTGTPTDFKNTITINVEVFIENKIIDNLIIVESFSYKNDSNKINLKSYEKEIKNNLAETATDKIIFELSNIQ